ncbi:lipoprotein [Dasania marina]|uniref:LPS translocon maturation chaperone LptM n=1 Tax=Dasania marina TaxID=471499 RepID=UPI0030D810A2|tara:strand:+ start:1727 stop:1945 length:219 start_codon:yes stop_codon:yes gene_type:complete
MRLPAPFILISLLLLLAGCGQKGPLFLPTDEMPEQSNQADIQPGNQSANQSANQSGNQQPDAPVAASDTNAN